MEREWAGTLNWFDTTASGVSAHIVIAGDGTIARVVADNLQAWHDRQNNAYYLGAELVQPTIHDPITEQQYRSLAWWLREMSRKYGFALSAENLPEHRQTGPGSQLGKSDVGYQFSLSKLLRLLG